MKRRNFLKGFAAAVAVVSVAPMAIANTVSRIEQNDTTQTFECSQTDFHECKFTYSGREYTYHLKKWEVMDNPPKHNDYKDMGWITPKAKK